MDIRNGHIFFVEEEVLLSRIANFFKPQDEIAKAFLAERVLLSYEGSFVREETPPAVEIAICIAPKGETLQGILDAIRVSGWGYGTLGDWYRYHTKFPFPEGEIIIVPGTTYFDENFIEWIPFVSPCKSVSLLQMITGSRSKIIAKVLLRIKGAKAVFQSRKQFLVSRMIEGKKDPQSEKSKGSS